MSAVLNAMLLNIVWLVVLAFFVLAVIGTANWLYWLRKGRQSRNWPTVPGTVVTSQLITRTDVHLTMIRALLTTTLYGVKIRYRYTVDGRSLEGGRIGLTGGGLACSDGAARIRLTEYPVGQGVTVHYQPNKPENADRDGRPRPVSERPGNSRSWVFRSYLVGICDEHVIASQWEKRFRRDPALPARLRRSLFTPRPASRFAMP